jgi:NAD(P)-dependent dehydrogenase (short-subunit alcohol dehydrogenase family)
VNLAGKAVLVTGAAGSGVGAGICRALGDAGARLVVNALTEEEAQRAAAEHGAVAGFTADVSDPAQVDAMFAAVDEQVGPLDGLVNNAGIGLDRPAHQASVEEFERLFAVDQRGVWLAARAFARQALRHGRPGSIVNISSIHALATMSGYALYAAAKAGVEGLTRGMAVELGGAGVRCNAISPGYVHSQQNLELMAGWTDDPQAWVRSHTVNQQALEREIEPIDCGWAAAFLLSDLSRCITGQVLRIDAGTTALVYSRDFR